MSTVPVTVAARDDAAGVVVEVGPGGGMHSLSLTDRAMRLGGDRLATAILALVRTATAQADQRVHNALPPSLHGSLAALGLGVEPDLADSIEETTPTTWMR